jgi:hypothetical protein
LRLFLVLDYQHDRQIGVEKEAAPNREGRVGNSNVHAIRCLSLSEKRGRTLQHRRVFLFQSFELAKLQPSDFGGDQRKTARRAN